MNIPGRVFEDGESVYSDWFPRGGDFGIFRLQLVDKGSSAVVTVTIYTKNSEDVGDGAAQPHTMTSSGMANGAVKSLLITDDEGGELLELIRYKLSCTGGWANARMLTPVFFDAAAG